MTLRTSAAFGRGLVSTASTRTVHYPVIVGFVVDGCSESELEVTVELESARRAAEPVADVQAPTVPVADSESTASCTCR